MVKIDINALKAKLDKMNNKVAAGRRPSHFWSPEVGEYIVRIVPWPDNVETTEPPFVERWFYYELGRKMLARPLNEPDPVRELRNTLFKNKTEENLALARSLRPKMRAFVLVLVKGEEGAGVKLWSLNQHVYKQILQHIVDPDYGDISDIKSGHDLKVTISDSGKKMNDRKIFDVVVTPKPKPRALTNDEIELLSNTPDITEVYPETSYKQLEDALNKWLNVDTSSDDKSVGTVVTSKTTSKDVGDDKPNKSLDDAFDELLG